MNTPDTELDAKDLRAEIVWYGMKGLATYHFNEEQLNELVQAMLAREQRIVRQVLERLKEEQFRLQGLSGLYYDVVKVRHIEAELAALTEGKH